MRRNLSQMKPVWEQLYLEGKSSTELARQFNVAPQVIQYHMKTRGLSRSISEAVKMSANSQWRGEDVGYSGLHEWVRRRLPKPDKCPSCNDRPALDLANISQEYRRDLSDWEWLCRKCHMTKDGRLKTNLKQFHEPSK